MQRKKITIVGGGILGLSCAFHLQKSGLAQVTVIEGGAIGAGTTSQAAALLTRARSHIDDGKMVDATHELIQHFEEQDERRFMHRHGCIHVADTHEQIAALQQHEAQARIRDVPTHWLNSQEMSEKLPWLTLASSSLGLFYPDDGHADPYLLTDYFARHAKAAGADIYQNTRIDSLHVKAAHIKGVNLADGETIASDAVLIAAGPWSSVLAAQAGVRLAMAPVRSHYWITDNQSAVESSHPMAIVPHSRAYFRSESKGLLFGVRDSQACVVDPEQLPSDQQSIHGVGFPQDSDGWLALEENWQALMAVCPLLENAQLSHYLSGISSYTPDGLPLLGETQECRGLYVATGCSGAGIAWSGGIGRLMSELMTEQPLFVDSTRYDLYRFENTMSVNPLNADFRRECALARANKKTG